MPFTLALLAACTVGPNSAAGAASSAGSDSALWAASSDHAGISGTEKPLRVRKTKSGRYVAEYRRYFVAVAERDSEVGENIWVYRKPSANAAWREGMAVDLLIREDMGWFFGVYGDHLFIDSSCCPCPCELIVYDLSLKKSIFSATYLDWRVAPTLRDGRWLTYLENLGDFEDDLPGVNCPEAAQWRRDKMGVGYEEKVVLDLRSLQKTRTGVITCSERE
jgi:hypothetical protein